MSMPFSVGTLIRCRPIELLMLNPGMTCHLGCGVYDEDLTPTQPRRRQCWSGHCHFCVAVVFGMVATKVYVAKSRGRLKTDAVLFGVKDIP